MDAVIPNKGIQASEYTVLKLRCPICRHAGSFAGFANCHDLIWRQVIKQRQGGGNYADYSRAGLRICPNPDCGALVFIAYEAGNGETVTYPPEVIDFDATNLPPDILSTLEEAIKCHASGCYRASALMIRRTLEELCDDKSAAGKDLKARLAALGAVAVIPSELLSAADELRILGNDAAHIEAKDYDAIGKEESEIAIELAKELLKAVYQYTSLVARLTALKKPKS